MFDTLRTDERIGGFLDSGSGAAHCNHLQAVIVIEMDVHRRDDVFVKMMMEVGELFVEEPNVVVVNKRYGADDHTCRRFPSLFDEVLAHQIAKRFGPVRITPSRDQAIKVFEKILGNGDADSGERDFVFVLCGPHSPSW